ncbi:hypothetical protein LAU42_09080 [Macrococcus armenti]|uniref:hypothetical protein n=1 Tax=Macrococcus armenti TaxID=2875764 RepID=UPI001CCAE5B1|nr:hypothetical protein [Macrococcus armenti]UBH21917.1 hypothetical protein LAU42_09080 [Macrococcus armenti]
MSVKGVPMRHFAVEVDVRAVIKTTVYVDAYDEVDAMERVTIEQILEQDNLAAKMTAEESDFYIDGVNEL